MLNHLLFCSGLAVAVSVGPAKADAHQFGTPNEAKAMLIRASAAMKADKASAIEKFNHNERRFRDRDLFVFCFNGQDGKFVAHEAFVAQDVRALRDQNGKAFGAEMYANARADRITEVDFVSPLPGTTELASKRAYVMRLDDQVCGVSAYKFGGQVSPTPK